MKRGNQMKTKWLLSSSAVMMGLLGLAGTFIPEEISVILGLDPSPITLILLQIIGGLYLGFAMLNWFTRSARIGGIYNKPVVLGNLIHFIVVLFAVIRQLAEQFHFLFVILTLVYLGFAVWFTLVMRSNPLSNQSKMSG
ncbi:multidrug DMT transporter permease [Cytobacillus praedii]|uniref:multidrug DMT transporter permease n=2 Tax=Cytobacillus praedii TaxID=1742358 RepID=UPI002E247F35|nr:multidrug DMT transporter permease [Cytobacillus praedii]